MINVSNDYKQRMKENRDFRNYAEITFADGTKTTLDASQFTASNNSLSDGADISSFPIGEAVEKIAQLEIINDDQQYADKDFLGAKIRLYTDFQLDEVDPFASRNLFALSKAIDGTLSGSSQKPAHGDSYGGKLVEYHTAEENCAYTISISGFFETKPNWSVLCAIQFYDADKNPVGVYNQISTKAGEIHDSKIVTSPANTAYFCAFFRPTDRETKFKIEQGAVDNPVYSLAPEDIRTERIEKGTYTVITPETYGETVIITAYDDMYKADKDYTTALTFPQTAGAVLRDICATCGISLGSSTFLHDDFIIQNKPTGKFREVIGQIAMIACGNARIDRQNRLQIISYNFDWGYNVNVVAGENLAKGTSDKWKTVSVGANYSEVLSGTYKDFGLSDSEPITYSIQVRSNSGKKLRARIEYYTSEAQRTSDISSEYVENSDGTLIVTGYVRAGYDRLRLCIDVNLTQTTHTGITAEEYKCIKLERGKEVTSWIPAQGETADPYYLLDEFTAPKIEYNDTVITGFKTIIKGETSEEDTEILQGTDTYCITVENPLISGQEQTVLSWLLEKIGNVPFRPFGGDAISNPLVEFMDLAKVQDRRGNQYNTFVTDVNFLMPGYTTLKNSTPSATRSAIAYTSNSARVEQRARQLVELEKNARELAVERLQEALAQGSGLYPTEERQPDGSTIYYLHDKPTKAESKVVIKLTSEGIGISQNGGNDYPWGITFTGEAILKLIYAVGIDCDYLTTGAITVRDDNGDIIFQVDMDTKSVIISGDHVRIGGKSATTALADNLTEAKNYSDGKLSDYANTVSKSITGLQEQIDGQIETFYYDYVPTLDNVPANGWKDETEKQKHQGDLFYNKKTGYAYRFFKDGTTWKWQLIQDTDITKAMQTAEDAQDTADHKRRVFVSTPTTPYDIGDLWVNGTDILTSMSTRAKGTPYTSTDWQKLNKYTDDTVANQALDEARKSTNLTIILDNEYQGILTDSTGKYSGTLSVSTIVQTYYGHQNVSASCTYTFQKSDGVTYTWDGATRKCTITALTTDTGWVDITASYMSLFTVTKRFNVAKVRAGAVGATGSQGINLLRLTEKLPIQNNESGIWTWPYGGSNTLFTDTGDGLKLTFSGTNTNDCFQIPLAFDGAVENNDTVTLSFKYRGTVTSFGTFYFIQRTAPNVSLGGFPTPVVSETEWKTYKHTFSSSQANVRKCYSVLLFYGIAVATSKGKWVEIKKGSLKLEKGSVSDPVWTPAPQDLVGPQGPAGKDGKGVSSTAVTYLASSSGTTVPSGNWQASVPPTSAGQFLWTKTVITYTDNSTTTMYAVSRNGNNGAAGAAGKGISAITNYYLATSAGSNVTTGTTGWNTNPATQTLTATNKYLWNYEVTAYTDGSSNTIAPHIIGVYGDKGATGGTGATGAAGKGIKGIAEYYAVSSSTTAPADTAFKTGTTPPAMTATDKYLWNYEVITYTDNTTYTSDKRIIGAFGNTGATGGKGDKGDKGDTGAAGRTYFMEPSTLIVKRSANNAMAPNYITLSAYYRDGTATARTAYAGRFKIEESLDGDKWTTVYTSAANESTITHSLYGALATSAGGAISSAANKSIGIPRDVVAIRCTLYAAGGTTQMLDMQTVAVVIDVDALTHEEIFNLLTNNGAMKGIYQEGNQLYISFTYAKGGILTLGGPNDGNGQINVLDGNGNVVGWWNKDGLFINSHIQTSGPGSLSNTMYMILSQFTLAGWYNEKIESFVLKCEHNQTNNNLLGLGIYVKDFYKLGFFNENFYRFSSDDYINTSGNTNVKRRHTFWGTERHKGNSYLSNVYLGSDDGNDIKLNWVNYGGAALAVQGGMYAYGDIGCSGKKNRVIDTEDYATRLQYSYEMSAPLFGDIGQAQTDENGECYIYLNDIFSETVSTQIEYQVFLQKEGKGDVWVEEKTWQYFVVKGTENLKFAWEIKAKQKQYEYDYLEKCEISEESEATINYEEEYIREINILIMKREEQLYETA